MIVVNASPPPHTRQFTAVPKKQRAIEWPLFTRYKEKIADLIHKLSFSLVEIKTPTRKTIQMSLLYLKKP